MLHIDLNSFAARANLWQLIFIRLKNLFVHTGSKNPQLVNHINHRVLTAVDTIKDLSVHISNDLSFPI